MSMAIMDEVRRIIAGALFVEESDLPQDLSQETCGRWTSMYHLTIVVALEEHFGLAFTTEEIVEMTSADAIVRVVVAHSSSPTAVRTS